MAPREDGNKCWQAIGLKGDGDEYHNDGTRMDTTQHDPARVTRTGMTFRKLIGNGLGYLIAFLVGAFALIVLRAIVGR